MSESTLSIIRAVAVMVGLLHLSGCAVTPEPVTLQERLDYANDKQARLTTDQEPINGKIDLYEATARALKYNLDAKVEVMQRAVRLSDLNLANYALLPELTASSGYAARNNYQGSTSRSLLTGNQSLEPSTSSERETIASDLSFSWNVLDFGLSYVRAHQVADEALIAEETRRKVVARIVEDVRTAYWRAVAGERLVGRLRLLERRVKSALRNSRLLAEQSQTAPLAALTYQRELIGIRREIDTLEGELSVAKAQLAALMNVPATTDFSLVLTPHGPTEVEFSQAELISIALTHRPELAEQALRGRINEKEATAALLSLLPGLQLYTSANTDTNVFLYNGEWINWGAKASWNVLRAFQYPLQKQQIDDKQALLDQQALALTMAIMTQVHVSHIRYRHALSELKTARDYNDVQRRILQQVRAQSEAGRMSEQALIREEMNALLSEAKRDLAYAALQNTVGSISASIGLDAVGAGVSSDMSVRDLAEVLRNPKPTPVSTWSTAVVIDDTPTSESTLPVVFSGFELGRKAYNDR